LREFGNTLWRNNRWPAFAQLNARPHALLVPRKNATASASCPTRLPDLDFEYGEVIPFGTGPRGVYGGQSPDKTSGAAPGRFDSIETCGTERPRIRFSVAQPQKSEPRIEFPSNLSPGIRRENTAVCRVSLIDQGSPQVAEHFVKQFRDNTGHDTPGKYGFRIVMVPDSDGRPHRLPVACNSPHH
jgi:hypothetical protein